MEKIQLSEFHIVFIHGDFKVQDREYCVHSGYCQTYLRDYEEKDHVFLYERLLNAIGCPPIVDRHGNDIRYKDEQIHRNGAECLVDLAKNGHVILFDCNLDAKYPAYIMYHPTYLTGAQAAILTNAFLECIKVDIEFVEVDDEGHVKRNQLMTNRLNAEEYLIELLHRSKEHNNNNNNNKEKVKVKSNLPTR